MHLMEFNHNFTYMLWNATAEDNVNHKIYFIYYNFSFSYNQDIIYSI
jgi:hypothetical protein